MLNFERINHEARGWYVEIHFGEYSLDMQEKFEIWIASHQQNQKIYDEVCAFMQRTEVYTSDPLCREKYKSILPEEYNVSNNTTGNFVVLEQSAQKILVSRRRLFFGSIAASLLLLVGVGVIFQSFYMDTTFETLVGEQRTVILDDGSTVKLNTNTQIKVDFSSHNRSVTLNRGQAYFMVAKDKGRPFVVNFVLGAVTALGTEFEVYKKEQEVIVSLAEGKVKVHRNKLQEALVQDTSKPQSETDDIIMVAEHDIDAGKQVTMSYKNISQVIKTDKKMINAWQKKHLVIRNKTLKYVIAEINRYSKQKIIIGNPELENEIVSGVFPTQSSAALEIINEYFNFKSTINSKNEIVLMRAL